MLDENNTLLKNAAVINHSTKTVFVPICIPQIGGVIVKTRGADFKQYDTVTFSDLYLKISAISSAGMELSVSSLTHRVANDIRYPFVENYTFTHPLWVDNAQYEDIKASVPLDEYSFVLCHSKVPKELILAKYEDIALVEITLYDQSLLPPTIPMWPTEEIESYLFHNDFHSKVDLTAYPEEVLTFKIDDDFL